MIAGHETTANSASWTILELCKHQDMQTRLRNEIRETKRQMQERGEFEFTAKHFDDMPYLNAFVKVRQIGTYAGLRINFPLPPRRHCGIIQ